jgi:GNAT superfamily N-acetyltransferase
MEIRPATPEDARAIAGVHVRSWQAGYRGIVAGEVLDALSVEERTGLWDGFLTDPDNDIRTLVADDDGAIVGFVSFLHEARDDDLDGVAEIPALYVDPSHWRRGVAMALMDAALARIGDRDVVLWVLEDNARGRAFYAGRGFTPDGARQRSGVDAPEIRLRARAPGPR